MGKHLVVVESPAKAKTINKILGKDFVVKSSVGHIRDLPEKKLGVDIENDFEPQYVVSAGKKKVITELKKAAKECDDIYLAPDPDREGEAIAWHLSEILKEASPDTPIHRVQYNEITPRAVKAAFDSPGELDMNRVNAQQARRILDRIVGYKVSPMLWRKIRRGLSAGRVQSVALRLVCEREKLIRAFKPDEYWILGAMVRKLIVPLVPFNIKLLRVNGEKLDVTNAEQAAGITEELNGQQLKVAGIAIKDVRKRPVAPLITSTLQQAASSKYSFSPKRTMSIAQKLYEGINLGKGTGPVGLITYMRTDSVNISQDAMTGLREFIDQKYGKDYIPETPNFYKSRSGAQEAHEAIRPTDVNRTPESLEGKLDAPSLKVYRLIWQRFVASQMTPAVLRQRTVKIESSGSEGGRVFMFQASASEVTFPGYMKVTGDDRAKKKEGDDSDEVEGLPELAEGEPLECLEWLSERKETKPPARFSEASLVKELEKNGVGRPSTYAAILSTLHQRQYVAQDKRSLSPTELGEKVSDLLVDKLGDLFNVEFTAGMEGNLDKVEAGEESWNHMLSDFYGNFEKWMVTTLEPPASTEEIKSALECLSAVSVWNEPVKRGRRTYSDEKFVQSVGEQLEKEEKPVTERQVNALWKIACRYKDQLSGVDELLARYEKLAILDDPETQKPKEATLKKLDLLAELELDESAVKFVTSLDGRARSGRALTPAQANALNSIVLNHAAMIENFESMKEELGLNDIVVEVDEESEVLIKSMSTVSEWNEPVKRGKRVFDDASFYQSLSDQFKRKGALSPKQRGALKRMVARYSDQIPGFDELAESLDIKKKA